MPAIRDLPIALLKTQEEKALAEKADHFGDRNGRTRLDEVDAFAKAVPGAVDPALQRQYEQDVLAIRDVYAAAFKEGYDKGYSAGTDDQYRQDVDDEEQVLGAG